jgi:hypothetical protein
VGTILVESSLRHESPLRAMANFIDAIYRKEKKMKKIEVLGMG